MPFKVNKILQNLNRKIITSQKARPSLPQIKPKATIETAAIVETSVGQKYCTSPDTSQYVLMISPQTKRLALRQVPTTQRHFEKELVDLKWLASPQHSKKAR